MLSAYMLSLDSVVQSIEAGEIARAEFMVSNLYFRVRPTADDYVDLLRATINHRAYVTASDNTKSGIARIFFLMDHNHNSSENVMYVEATQISAEDAPSRQFVFSIKERNTPSP